MKRATFMIVSLLAASAVFAAGASASAPSPPSVAASQQTAAMLSAHTVYDHPYGKVVATIPAVGPLTRERTIVPVLARAINNSVVSAGQTWLEVRLPGRAAPGATPPATGWIMAAGSQTASTSWHIVVHLAARRVLVYFDGRQVRSYAAIVGKPSTPTPAGTYFVEENVRMLPGAPGAPFALATSDRSKILHEFEGGPGEIAIHGLENVGGTLGTAESHGCIRIANAAVSWLAARVGPGTPITID